MKTTPLQPLRVNPSLRTAAKRVLQQGETLSSFVDQSIRLGIERRRMQNEFVARGLASRDEAKETGEYFSAADVMAELDRKLSRAKAKARSR